MDTSRLVASPLDLDPLTGASDGSPKFDHMRARSRSPEYRHSAPLHSLSGFDNAVERCNPSGTTTHDAGAAGAYPRISPTWSLSALHYGSLSAFPSHRSMLTDTSCDWFMQDAPVPATVPELDRDTWSDPRMLLWGDAADEISRELRTVNVDDPADQLDMFSTLNDRIADLLDGRFSFPDDDDDDDDEAGDGQYVDHSQQQLDDTTMLPFATVGSTHTDAVVSAPQPISFTTTF